MMVVIVAEVGDGDDEVCSCFAVVCVGWGWVGAEILFLSLCEVVV